MKPRTVQETTSAIARLMQPEDANPGGIIHGGVVMKEIDNAAGVVALRHARKVAVTASIDRIDFYKPIFIGNLLTIKASMNYAGKSSMEIGARVEAEDLLTGEVRHVASAYLTFVALGKDLKGTEVPKLILETDDEIRRNNEARARKKARQALKHLEKTCNEKTDVYKELYNVDL